MKILYLSHRIPYPPNKGDKIRSFNEIKYFSGSHETHLGCLVDNPHDLRYERDLRKYCGKLGISSFNRTNAKVKGLISLLFGRPFSVGYFYSKSLQTTINHWLSSNNYDAIICFSSPMADYLFRSPHLRHRFTSGLMTCASRRAPLLVMDFCDVDSDKWLQYSQWARFPLSWIYKIESKLLFKYERQINQSFDQSVFVSEKEADMFLKLFPEARNVTAISNGVDYEYFSPDGTYPLEATQTPNQLDERNKLNKLDKPATSNQKPILLFTGAMDYYANVDGVIWFCNEIFPELKKEFPQAQFYIVGSNPNPKVGTLENMVGIKVPGFVEDIRPYYQAADICVIPLRMARGLQNKVLEAMAMGKAIVATSRAVEGVEAVPRKHVLVEDTPEGFAKAVSRLMKDQELRNRLGADGREFVMEKYDWHTNMKKFEHLLSVG